SQPRTIVVYIPAVARARNVRGASVTNSQIVTSAQRAGGNRAFRLRADEVHRNEAAAENDHVRARDGGLQPGSMMEGRVPVVHRSVIATERELCQIVPVVANDGSLQIDVVDAGCRR